MCQILEAKTPWDNAVRGRVFMVTWHGVYFQALLCCLSDFFSEEGLHQRSGRVFNSFSNKIVFLF